MKNDRGNLMREWPEDGYPSVPGGNGGWFLFRWPHPVKAILILMILFIMAGCNAIKPKSIQKVSDEVDKIAIFMVQDWPKVSGALQGLLGDKLSQATLDDIKKIDGWFKKDGKWLSNKKIAAHVNRMPYWKIYYIAAIRVGHIREVVKTAMETYAPGLMGIPEVISFFAFIGMGL